MECLRNRIGLEGCGATSPASSLFVNSLPGISVKSIAAMSTDEAATYLDVWDKIQTRTIYRFATELRSALASKYKLASALKSFDLGQVIDATDTIAGVANEYRGVTFDLANGIESDRKRSNFAAHYVKEIKFYSTGVVNGATFKVYDCLSGATLWSKTQDLAIGWNTVNVGQTFTVNKVWVCVLATSITTVELDIEEVSGCSDCGVTVYGAKGTTATALTEGDNAFGLSVVYSVVCKLDALACSLSETFDLPLWYLHGSELMLERLTSDRINKWTVNREQAKELKDHYDAEFERTMKLAVDGLTLDASDICLECSPLVSIKQSPLFGC